MISPKTQLCISLSARPSHFGMTVHNAGYNALGLDFFYKAFQIQDIGAAITGVRALGIRGCSISMPFKEEVIPYLDALHDEAKKVSAVNTVINEQGYLTGYNTDVTGARDVFAPHINSANDVVLVLGSGGVARAIVHALQSLNIKKIIIAARSPEKTSWIKNKGLDVITWSDREKQEAEVLINATPIGMSPEINMMPVNSIDSYKVIMDAVANPMETKLITEAKRKNKIVISGVMMALHQAYEQFYLYTGYPAPKDIMQNAILRNKQ